MTQVKQEEMSSWLGRQLPSPKAIFDLGMVRYSTLETFYHWYIHLTFDINPRTGRRMLYLAPYKNPHKLMTRAMDLYDKNLPQEKDWVWCWLRNEKGHRTETTPRGISMLISPDDLGAIEFPFTDAMEAEYQAAKIRHAHESYTTRQGKIGADVAMVFIKAHFPHTTDLMTVGRKEDISGTDIRGFNTETCEPNRFQIKCRAETQTQYYGNPALGIAKMVLQGWEHNNGGYGHDGEEDHNAGGSGVGQAAELGSGIFDPIYADWHAVAGRCY